MNISNNADTFFLTWDYKMNRRYIHIYFWNLKWAFSVSFERCAEDFAEFQILSAQNGLLDFEFLKSMIRRLMCFVWMPCIIEMPHLLAGFGSLQSRHCFIQWNQQSRLYSEAATIQNIYRTIFHYILSTINFFYWV